MRLAAAGAAVCIADVLADEAEAAADEIRALGHAAMAQSVDLSDVSVIQYMVESVVTQFGRLDMLVNNAAVTLDRPMLDVTEDEWDRVININQKAVFFCTQAEAAQMIRQMPAIERRAEVTGGSTGKIVNVASMQGRRGNPELAVYAASKAAVISLTKSAALAFAPYNINVNAIAPGIVDAPMLYQVIRGRNLQAGRPAEEGMENVADEVPLNRVGSVEEMASAVVFLCSAESDYVTGQCLNVDGGAEMD